MMNTFDINKLLDRIEILNPEDPFFSDLRRAYIDKEIYSILRLVHHYYGDDAYKFKSMLSQHNLKILFDFVDGKWIPNFELRDDTTIHKEDLSQFIINSNYWALYRILLDHKDMQIVKAIKKLHQDGIDFNHDSLSRSQLKSKKWLVDELENLDLDLGTVFLCAGWYGILSLLMFERNLKIDKIRSIDIDESCIQIAEIFNHPWVINGWKFKAIHANIHDVNYDQYRWFAINSYGKNTKQKDSPDTIINTSCEHIENFASWYDKIPSGKIVILQSNDFAGIDEHVNTVSSLEEFTSQTPMQEELFSGELELENYTRFMRIGIK